MYSVSSLTFPSVIRRTQQLVLEYGFPDQVVTLPPALDDHHVSLGYDPRCLVSEPIGN